MRPVPGMADTQRRDRSEVAATDQIRAQFPALDRVHGGQPVAYFAGPGGTQVPRCVADAMVDYLYHHNANTDWAYPTSIVRNGARVAEAVTEFEGESASCLPL